MVILHEYGEQKGSNFLKRGQHVYEKNTRIVSGIESTTEIIIDNLHIST